MENKNIVMRIKILIEHENVSPSKFAKMIDFNQSNLSKILKGDRNVAPNLINAICDNLNVSYKWLVNGEGSMFLTEPSNAQPIKTYINDELIEVPIVDADAAATFIENMYDQHYNIDKYGVMQEEGEDLNSGEYVVFKVVGESMVPTIPDNAKVLAMRIPEERWEELSGVVFVVYGKMFVIKRILKNSLFINNIITLKSDNPLYGQMEVGRTEIRGMWKAIRIVSQRIV
ncbi:S24 family peptidase [Prevotella pallens]|uniref:LexA family transcriptional regulator n=1 Tax=Prevotella pallens TaxID=60133 RepID=UPI0028DB5052|nr:S24 family peptidase [Prevotella pallens]